MRWEKNFGCRLLPLLCQTSNFFNFRGRTWSEPTDLQRSPVVCCSSLGRLCAVDWSALIEILREHRRGLICTERFYGFGTESRRDGIFVFFFFRHSKKSVRKSTKKVAFWVLTFTLSKPSEKSRHRRFGPKKDVGQRWQWECNLERNSQEKSDEMSSAKGRSKEKHKKSRSSRFSEGNANNAAHVILLIKTNLYISRKIFLISWIKEDQTDDVSGSSFCLTAKKGPFHLSLSHPFFLNLSPPFSFSLFPLYSQRNSILLL